MRWKPFLIPVKSLSAAETKEFISHKSVDQFTLLDVRQPEEYETAHIPGAKLIPLPDLHNRINEIDPNKATVVY